MLQKTHLRHLWRVVTLGLLLALAAPAAQAQVNTEKLRAKKPKDGFYGFVAGTVLYQTGNVSILSVGVGARLAYVKGIHRPFIQGDYSLGAKNGDRYLHNGFLHARWPAMWHRRVGSEVFSQIQFNEFKMLDLRALAGAGVRVAPVLTKYVELYIGSGYMFEYENLSRDPLVLHPMAGLEHARHPKTTYHHRWTNYISLRVDVKKWVSITSVTYAQPRFDKFSDVRVLEDFSLDFKVNKHLHVILAFILDWDSDPPIEVKPLDTKTLTSLKYSF